MKLGQLVALTVVLLALPVTAEGPNDKPAVKRDLPERYFSPPPPFPNPGDGQPKTRQLPIFKLKPEQATPPVDAKPVVDTDSFTPIDADSDDAPGTVEQTSELITDVKQTESTSQVVAPVTDSGTETQTLQAANPISTPANAQLQNTTTETGQPSISIIVDSPIEETNTTPAETDVEDIQPETGTAGESSWDYNVAVEAKEFMVSAAHPLAVEAGYKVLKAGGTAMDAAVAVQLVLNVVEPQSSGLGGGAFLLHWDAEKKELIAYDGRETAPAYVTPNHFLDTEGNPLKFFEAVSGGKSIGVPGTLRLLETAHINHGKQLWSDLVLPAIEIANNGFEITPRLAESIKGAAERGLKDFHRAREYFFNEQGEPLKAGTKLKNVAFAELLQKIRTRGADVLYIGQYAQGVVSAVNNAAGNPGNMTLQDLQDYEVKIREPVCVPYREYKVCGMGPPSSGALTVGQILGILQHFDMPGLRYDIDAVHFFLEAAKLAYADRGRYMADEDFVNMPTQGLLDPAYLTARAQQIGFDTTIEKARPGNPPWINGISLADDESLDRPGTTHFSIVDKYGNIVSMTSTIETGFGSRLMVHGFLLNNELTDFSFVSEKEGRLVANRIEPGKRPRSSMAPTIVFDAEDNPVLAIGSPGGSRIINYVAKVIVSVLDWNFDVQSSINMGHFANRNGDTDIEQSSSSVRFESKLVKRGHVVKLRDLNSGLHGIQIMEDGTLIGGADPRREGIVMGE